jgi:tetratricopeptide (TPR) repeat protein
MDLFKRAGQQPATDGQRFRKADEAARAGMAFLEAGNPRQAEVELRKAVGFTPENAGMRGCLGLALFRLGRLAEANKELQTATGMAPANSVLRYTHGQILEGLLRHDEAADEYAVASSLNPGNASYVAALASLEMKRNNVTAAEDLVRIALDLDPDEPQALADRADILHQRGDLAGAIAAMQRSIAVRPDNADDQYRLGTFLEDAGHLDLAINHLRLAFNRLHGDVEVVYALSRVLMKSGREAEAISVYTQVMKQNPDNRSIYEMDLSRLKAEHLKGMSSQTGYASRPGVTPLHPTPATPPPARPVTPPSASPVWTAAQDALPRPSAIDATEGASTFTGPAPLAEPQPTSAIARLEAAVAADPNNSRLHQELSILYLQSGQLAAAKEQGRLAEALRAQRPQVRTIKPEISKGRP